MVNKFYFVPLILLLFSFQDAYPYNIQCKIKGLPDKVIKLGKYSGPDLILIDSVITDSKGYAEFKENKKLEHGVYFILLHSSSRFDILIGEDQNFKITTHKFHVLDSLSVKGSYQNKAFIKFQRKMAEFNLRGRQLEVEKKFYSRSNKDSLKAVKKRLKQLSSERLQFYDSIYGFFNGVLLGDLAKALIPVKPPEKIQSLKTLKPEKYYNWVKYHFFDNINFNEEGVFNSPEYIFHRKLKQYCRYFIDNNASKERQVKSDLRNLIDKAAANKTAHKYVLSFLIENYSDPEVVGTGFIYVFLADNYFSDKKVPWAVDSLVRRINYIADQKRNNLVGRKAYQFKLPNIKGDYINPLDTIKKYKILWFWAPSCSACEELTKQLHEEYEKLRKNNINIAAIYYGDKKSKWMNYIKYHDFQWTNIWNPHGDSGIEKNYGLYKTPRLYIINNKKKIVAKDIHPSKILKYVEFLKTGDQQLKRHFIFNPPVFVNN